MDQREYSIDDFLLEGCDDDDDTPSKFLKFSEKGDPRTHLSLFMESMTKY